MEPIAPEPSDQRQTGPPAGSGVAALVAWAAGAKLALVGLLVHAALHPDLPQYQDKAMGYRLVVYPALVAVVPVVWAFRRGRAGDRRRYPWAVDLCVTAPFLLDAAGNAWNLYDTVEWWDDAMHVATWVPWVLAFGLAMRRRAADPVVLGMLTLGFGAVTHVVWELAEYVSFVATHPIESRSAYRDTMGDFALSLLGSLVGALAVVAATRRPVSAADLATPIAPPAPVAHGPDGTPVVERVVAR